MGLNSITVQLVFISTRKSDLFGFQIQSCCLVRRQNQYFICPLQMLVIGGPQMHIHFSCAETATE